MKSNIVILVLSVVSVSCVTQIRNLSRQPSSTSIKLSQGWNDEDRQYAYEKSHGTQLMPFNWFVALEQSQSKDKFTSLAESFGFVPSEKVRGTTNALPIGITSVEDERTEILYGEKKWVSINCTACHTRLIEVNGHSVVIDGASSNLDIQKFERELIRSVDATLQDKEKLLRFARGLNETDIDSLSDRLTLFRAEFTSWVDRNHIFKDKNGKQIEFGPGRIDGLGGATNDLICSTTERLGEQSAKSSITDHKNCRTSSPPSEIPFLWGITQAEFTQWNGVVHSSLGRNYGATTAAYGKSWVEKDQAGKIVYKSTADIPALFAFERLYDKLRSPQWNDLAEQGVVERLDEERVANGRATFEIHCASCHSSEPANSTPNKFGNSYWKVKVVPASEVQTDSAYIEVESQRKANIPDAILADVKARFGSAVAADNTISAAALRSFVLGNMILNDFKLNGVALANQAKFTNCRDSSNQQAVVGYRARTLEGVWITAPYLHNGSVPTLADLLETAAKRPKVFYKGCNKYDVEKLGYDCRNESSHEFRFDTSLYGNSNSGHEYGVQLSPREKQELLFYIKSLNQPANATPKNPFCN